MKDLPKDISLLRDRLFTRDIQKTVIGMVFADVGNKLFTSRQEQRQKERDRKYKDKIENESYENINNGIFQQDQSEKLASENEMMRRLHRVMKVNKSRFCMNGTLMQTDFVLE